MEKTGFVDVAVGPPVDTFGGARGEPNARRFAVMAHVFTGRKPG